MGVIRPIQDGPAGAAGPHWESQDCPRPRGSYPPRAPPFQETPLPISWSATRRLPPFHAVMKASQVGLFVRVALALLVVFCTMQVALCVAHMAK